ncbi:MAG: hypothetical protein HYR63_27785 [Proteobacteria bacterium]|nr:hypothetical protein [Pseudomonadota bacterium]MBI3497890.1 hypothetical protein [Pseudomonadota bacterium]
MFGFSMTKLLVLAAIIAAVWYGYRWINRVELLRRQAAARGEPAMGKRPSAPSETMVACSTCGTYVAPRAARSCGRSDCPYPG